MNDNFSFYMPVRIVSGLGSSKEMSSFVKGENVFIISDPFLFKSGVAKEIGESLAGKTVTYFADVEPNPTCKSVDIASSQARAMKADCVIGIGGGSALDVAKIVACLVTNEGSIYDYYAGGKQKLSSREVTLICIPTTAGTGSEVTNVGVYTDQRVGAKMPMVEELFWPDVAILDDELTFTLPADVTAATGMDAFCHGIEAYWSEASVPISDVLAVEALKLIFGNLRKATLEPNHREARHKMLYASLLSGVAFSQTRTTGVHAVSFPLTTEFNVSHGLACAITLPAFIRISGEKKEEKMARLAKELGYENINTLADAVETLMEEIGLPTRLNELGVTKEDLKHIAEVGLRAPVVHLTPATMNEETLHTLLKTIL